MLPVEQNTTRKRQINEFQELEIELNAKKDKTYKDETSKDSAIYNEVSEGQFLGLYHLIF